MNRRHNGITMIEVLAVLVIIGFLVLLMFPAMRGARGPARRNHCSNQMRQVCLATLNRESMTERFPLASLGGSSVDRFGPTPMSQDDGYSVMVQLLSYMEETALADEILAASNEYQEPISSDRFLVEGKRGRTESLWDRPVELLICPDFPGEGLATGKYPNVKTPQVSNYHALAAAYVDRDDQRVADLSPTSGGVIVTQEVSPKGLRMGDLKDGTSKTLLFSESRAERWSAWFSGTSTTTIALPPDLVRAKDLVVDKDGFQAVPAGVPSGLNYGRSVSDPTNSPPRMFWESKVDQRDWGPSSAHSGDVVMHGFADGHVKALNAGIDATTYLRLVTRAGGEPASDD